MERKPHGAGLKNKSRRKTKLIKSDLTAPKAPIQGCRIKRWIPYIGAFMLIIGALLLALFGIPTAHEDDPLRAVKAALELHEMVRHTSPEVEGRIGKPLRMHTGINTGLIVTHLRDDRDGLFGITGKTVNTGARLRSQAG